MKDQSETKPNLILTSPSEDIYRIGNLSFYVKNEYVLAASAMPELESPKMDVSEKLAPELWRGWAVAVGPGIRLSKTKFTYNPGVQIGNYIYFLPETGSFFSFDNILFVFVKMSDVVLSISI